jgi:fumarylpyruvate hydrolase
MAKGFDDSAVCGPLQPVTSVAALSHGAVELWVNGQARQHGDLAELIWSIPEIIADLSRWVELRAGDLIYTGTPEGVGPVIAGDELRASIDGVGELQVRVIAPAHTE